MTLMSNPAPSTEQNKAIVRRFYTASSTAPNALRVATCAGVKPVAPVIFMPRLMLLADAPK